MDGAAEGKHDLEVPSYFKCPISMQTMTDPVVLSTGVTYDRESIEKWLYVCGKDTCPATMQRLHNRDLTPNHTLRRLIQGWCAANTSTAIHPIPTPIDPSEVHKLLQQVLHSPHFQVTNALTKLRGLVGHSETNRRCIAAAGASDVLISVVETFSLEIDEGICRSFDGSRACEEALAILYRLLCNPAPHMADDDDYEKLAYNCKCVKSIAWILKRATSQGRFHAAMLFHNIVITKTANQEFLTKVSDDDLLEGLLGLLTEEVCHKATVSALEILMAICRSSRRNRIKVIEAGAVHVLIRSLSETQIRASCENMLCLLDVFCDCAEGRAAVIEHAMGIAVVSIHILTVSDVATEKAVRILWSLCKFNPSPFVLQEMVQIGGVSKLCMLLQFGCTSDSKHRAKQVLRLNERLWRKSPCIPLYLRRNYPSDH